ncbi:MAG: hypothetical protein ACKOOL_02490 [Novosphingobium sp.]
MNKAKTLVAFVLALLAQLFAVAPAQAKWLRGETRHFVVYSSGSAKEMQKFGLQLERFDKLLRTKFDIATDENPNKLTVYFLGSQDAVSNLYAGRTQDVAGFYSPQKEGSYAVANRTKGDGMFDLDGMTVLFHEYAHHFMFRNFSYAYPSWYVEGFAEYFSTVTFKDDGNWTMGKPAYHRAYGLIEGVHLPIDKLLFGDTEGLTPEQTDVFYGRSWLLVHMLSASPAYKGKASAYFTAIAQGKSEREAAAEVFGDLKQFDKALDSYLNGKLAYWSSKNPLPADGAMTASELDDISGRLVMLKLNRLQGRVDAKSRDSLKALAQANPGRADLWYELALAERELVSDAEKPEKETGERAAELAADKALAADPNHVRANVLKADILFKRLESAGNDSAADWTRARSYLVTANAHAVDDPTVLLEWYDSYVFQRRTPSKVAHAALQRAFELEPEVTEVRVQYAFDLANQGEFDRAIRLVEFLAHDPHEGEAGRKLLAMLTAMRDAKAPDKSAAPAK